MPGIRKQIVLICFILFCHVLYRLFFTTEDRFSLLFNNCYALVSLTVTGLLLFSRRKHHRLYYAYTFLVVAGWLAVFRLAEAIRTEGLVMTALSVWLAFMVFRCGRRNGPDCEPVESASTLLLILYTVTASGIILISLYINLLQRSL